MSPFDSIGRPNSKTCICGVQTGRTRKVCAGCGHEFISRDRIATEKRAAKLAAREAAPAAVELPPPVVTIRIAPPGRQLQPFVSPAALEQAAARMAVPASIPSDAAFICEPTPQGGLLLLWPVFGIRFTLTKSERERVRAVVIGMLL